MSDSAPVTTRRREATRQRLLDAAARVFAEVGFDAASVEAVCEAAGYTRGAFYSNFASKEELFLELCARAAAAQIAAVRAAVADFASAPTGDDIVADTLALVSTVLEASADDRSSVLLMSEVRIHGLRNVEIARAYRRQAVQMTAELAEILRELTRSQGFAVRVTEERAAELLVSVWVSAAEGAVMDGLDQRAMRARIGEALAVVVELVVEKDR